ncbi:Signal transduction histidine kinase [Algoriphagus alkaliphilus]|uniref:histidine kinase n=1 Tax=Algoriphagus alkaliphilus TaxID=279824 RepID=A0A1G5ZQH0_9BACT|nr:sensor histidine kinase [Algoriphagus alkaliphilus]SDA97064.1 Signal transduction histidine kinase [Algoriphagus alkaliphilus]
MSKELQFRISSGLKNIIGKDLITDDFIAIFELVKNSFDAHATKVEIEFENILSSNGNIKITDNGKGMNYDDLLNKWLFVAYSAKKDGTEDIDYRNKIQSKIYYAGAKGIGRFSCDKLGSYLTLTSTKDELNSQTEQIVVDWSKFEQNAKDEFINVSVNHQTLKTNPSKFQTGTMLEIYGLRNDSVWDVDKLLRLKNSLAKLINPFSGNNKRQFEIKIIANDFIEHDSLQIDNNRKINGLVENHLLEILKEKTIKIFSEISLDGKTITTELSNNGVWLYRIKEENEEFVLLQEIVVELYHLNRAAKNNFTRQMGMKAGEYGSVFLYKNGIRVYPFGEPGEDSFELDRRQQNRLGDFVGTSELIGRIEILGENEEFKETTSRGDGLIKNSSYNQLKSFFIEKVIVKLESFKKNILKYGVDIEEFENTSKDQEKIVRLIADISSSDKIESIEFNPNLIDIISHTQEESSSAKSLLKSIEKLARDTDNPDLIAKIKKVKNTLDDAIVIADLAEEEIREKEKEIKENVAQNLFLKSLKSQDLVDLVSLMHHIGISSGIISNHLKILTYKIDKNIPITNEELKRAIGVLNLENHKILSISRFATKANFKMNAEDQRLDMIEFITQYIENIAGTYNSGIKINLHFSKEEKFITNFKPIEMTIIIDNLINNSKKANADVIDVTLTSFDHSLIASFSDNGVGIPPKDKKKIFDFGFTTTGGSGLGLTHIKEILSKINGKIEYVNKAEPGAEFLLTFNK